MIDFSESWVPNWSAPLELLGGWGMKECELSYLSISLLKRVPLDYRIWVFGVLTPTSATDECCCLREHLMWGTSLCSCSGSKIFPPICLSTRLGSSTFGLILFFFSFGLGWGVTWKMHADEDTTRAICWGRVWIYVDGAQLHKNLTTYCLLHSIHT